MKKVSVICAMFISVSAHASDSKLVCTRHSEGTLLEEKTLTVTLNADEIKFEANFFGKQKTVSGKFVKTARNGNLIYDGSDLTDLVDQADVGNIFVAPQLLKHKPGTIGLSVRQLGDSEGFNWINDTFNCR